MKHMVVHSFSLRWWLGGCLLACSVFAALSVRHADASPDKRPTAVDGGGAAPLSSAQCEASSYAPCACNNVTGSTQIASIRFHELAAAPALSYQGVSTSSDASVVLAVATDSAPVLSLDSGASWKTTSAPAAKYVECAVSGDGRTLVACAADSGASVTAAHNVQMSRDGGLSWFSAPGLPSASGQCRQVAVSDDGRTVLATLVGFSDQAISGLYVSRDGGQTWTQLASGDRVYDPCVSGDGGKIGVLRAEDVMLSSHGSGQPSLSVAFHFSQIQWGVLFMSRSGRFIAAAEDYWAVGQIRSSDGGATWQAGKFIWDSAPIRANAGAWDGERILSSTGWTRSIFSHSQDMAAGTNIGLMPFPDSSLRSLATDHYGSRFFLIQNAVKKIYRASSCRSEAAEDYSLQCPPGQQGRLCEFANTTASTVCASAPCANGGSCFTSRDSTSFMCSCAAGFSGVLCETNINECGSSPCPSGATCVDGINGYACICPASYGSVRCEAVCDTSSNAPCACNNVTISTQIAGIRFRALAAAPTLKSYQSVSTSSDASVVLAVATDSAPVLSLDSGASWKTTSAPAAKYVECTVSGDGRTLVACAADSGASVTAAHNVQMSRDGGLSWFSAPGLPSASGQCRQVSVSDDGRTVLATLVGFSDQATSGLYVSRDGGQTWTQLASGDRVYDPCVSGDGGKLGVLRAEDVMLSSHGSGQPSLSVVFHFNQIQWGKFFMSRSGRFIFAGEDYWGSQQIRSIDGGATWQAGSLFWYSAPTRSIASSWDAERILSYTPYIADTYSFARDGQWSSLLDLGPSPGTFQTLRALAADSSASRFFAVTTNGDAIYRASSCGQLGDYSLVCPAGFSGSLCTCPTGSGAYVVDAHGYCVDVNECATNNGGCSTSPYVTCINLDGSHMCDVCPPGYHGNGTTCDPIEFVISYNGNGCNESGSVVVSMTPDGNQIAILYNKMLVDLNGADGTPSSMLQRLSCSVAIPVPVPPGYSVSTYKIDYRGFETIPPHSYGRLDTEFFFGDSPSVAEQHVFPPDSFDLFDLSMMRTGIANLSESQCGGSVLLRLSTALLGRLDMRDVRNDLYVQLDSIDASRNTSIQLKWHRCGPCAVNICPGTHVSCMLQSDGQPSCVCDHGYVKNGSRMCVLASTAALHNVRRASRIAAYKTQQERIPEAGLV